MNSNRKKRITEMVSKTLPISSSFYTPRYQNMTHKWHMRNIMKNIRETQGKTLKRQEGKRYLQKQFRFSNNTKKNSVNGPPTKMGLNANTIIQALNANPLTSNRADEQERDYLFAKLIQGKNTYENMRAAITKFNKGQRGKLYYPPNTATYLYKKLNKEFPYMEFRENINNLSNNNSNINNMSTMKVVQPVVENIKKPGVKNKLTSLRNRFFTRKINR